jgi:hypothetical protein
MAIASTLAVYPAAKIMAAKSFIVQAPAAVGTDGEKTRKVQKYRIN